VNVNAIGEFVHFDRRDSVTGIRWDLRPYVTLPYRTASTFVVPKATLRYTGYSLDGRAPGLSDDPSRLLPTFSLDSGLFLERHTLFASRQLVQTLEPRLYYLFTPFDRQDDLPVFDTGEYTFSFAQLFREDRFSGADRVGDAHQVTLALTTRFLDERSGAELLRASIGQIRYLRDRKVTLPGVARDTTRGSDLVAEVVANLDRRWRVSAGAQWDPRETRTDRNTVAVRYQPDDRRVLNLAYRFVRDAVEQTDLSFAWPVAQHWRAVGRWNYSLEGSTTLETFAGVEYEDCCWGFRVGGRRYLNSFGGEHNTAVFAQLVLKGLTALGDAREFLSRSIPGYRNEF
jgi:LPS-assembly protein